MKLINKTILITGGTSGIGLELGKELQAKNKRVILLGRNTERLDEAKSHGFETIQCDLSNPNDLEAAVVKIQNEYPDLDVLFNNAGMQYNYLFSESITPQEKIRKEIDVNLSSQIIFTQMLIPIMTNSKDALIVNTTSGLGAYPKEDGLVYSASKAGMRSFTIGLRNSLKNTSIKVVEFIPPVTATAMTQGRDENKMSAADLVKTIIPQIEKGKTIATVSKIRMFLWISFLFPGLAHKTLSKD